MNNIKITCKGDAKDALSKLKSISDKLISAGKISKGDEIVLETNSDNDTTTITLDAKLLGDISTIKSDLEKIGTLEMFDNDLDKANNPAPENLSTPKADEEATNKESEEATKDMSKKVKTVNFDDLLFDTTPENKETVSFDNLLFDITKKETPAESADIPTKAKEADKEVEKEISENEKKNEEAKKVGDNKMKTVVSFDDLSSLGTKEEIASALKDIFRKLHKKEHLTMAEKYFCDSVKGLFTDEECAEMQTFDDAKYTYLIKAPVPGKGGPQHRRVNANDKEKIAELKKEGFMEKFTGTEKEYLKRAVEFSTDSEIKTFDDLYFDLNKKEEVPDPEKSKESDKTEEETPKIEDPKEEPKPESKPAPVEKMETRDELIRRLNKKHESSTLLGKAKESINKIK